MKSVVMQLVVAQGEAIGPELLGPLRDSAEVADNPNELSQRMSTSICEAFLTVMM